MNKLTPAKRAQVVAALVEGNSIRATVRMTGVAKNTVTKLLVGPGRGVRALPAGNAGGPPLSSRPVR